MKRLLLLATCALVVAAPAVAKKRGDALPVPTSTWSDAVSRDRLPEGTNATPLRASAVANTLVLANYRFESGSSCNLQGWAAVDVGPGALNNGFVGSYAQAGSYWHVDDFASSNSLGTIPPGHVSGAAGLPFTPIQGAKSMWCGKRIPPAGPIDTIHCSYLALPGYGNGWNQAFITKNCIAVAGGATSGLDVAFKLKFDSEPSYDATVLEYTTDCSGDVGWIKIDGGIGYWDSGAATLTPTIIESYPVSGSPVRVRLRFLSDTAISNQEGLYPGFGAAVDSLSIETLPVEDFEGEALGSNESNDWTAQPFGFGNYLALFKQSTGANYEDECANNMSCYWAAIQGSTEFYNCGTPSQPTQRIVPHMNVRGEYIANEIWSPIIPLSGSGSEFRLRYTVYRDLPIDNLIFHQWHVRTVPANGCPGPWQDRQTLYHGDTKDWAVADHSIGAVMNTATATGMQVAIGVIDMCPFWCGVYGTGSCHSPAPYFDNVQVLRVDTVGPQWDVRVIDTYQDTFAADGTITGTARIDAAIDVKPTASPTFAPGDSAVVFFLVDPKYVSGFFTNANGLLPDPAISTFAGRHKTKKQAYMWVQVWPYDGVDDPGDKVGADLSDGPGGQANRYPFAGTQSINGTLWTKIRMDFTYTGSPANPGIGDGADAFVRNRFNVDLNDNLFTPGDTILYFFGATSADGSTYYSSEWGPTSSISEVAANPMEVTILPAGGYNRGGDILYVDGADDEGVQSYYHGAFMILFMDDLVDRYDVRSPSSGHANRLAGRVTNIQNQLNDVYAAILWDTGSLPLTLGDGSGSPLKTNDYQLLNTYLGNGWSTNPSTNGGVFLLGDRLAEELAGYAGASAVTFRSTYMPFTLINANHRLAPSLFAISPAVKFWPGRAYTDDFTLAGGCAALNDFDVIGASGASRVEMSYNTASNANGAVISKQTAVTGGTATAIMAGFSLAYVRDDELNGVSDRAKFIRDSFGYMVGNLGPPIGVGDSPGRNELSQNYPNPFNPTTTIAFSLKTRGHVQLNVYDVAGRLVRELANEVRTAGAHTVTWDGRDGNGDPVASGVYFYRLTAPQFTTTRKMVLLK